MEDKEFKVEPHRGSWWRSDAAHRIAEQAAGSAIGTLSAILVSAIAAKAFGLLATLTGQQLAVSLLILTGLSGITTAVVSAWKYEPTPEEVERTMRRLQLEVDVMRRLYRLREAEFGHGADDVRSSDATSPDMEGR